MRVLTRVQVILSSLLLFLIPTGVLAQPTQIVQVTTELPDDFLSAKPTVQLFKAYAEFKMANYELAKAMWLNVKGSAKPDALFNVGILYDEGKGVDASITQAIEYYEMAALAGSRSAAYQLGLTYLHDKRIQNDEEAARHWLSLAAYQGDKDAAHLLASLNPNGTNNDNMVGVQSLLAQGSNDSAVERLQLLAEEGNTAAKTQLAWLYEAGIGVEKDLNQAAALFSQAAQEGSSDAQYAIAVMSMTGTGLPENKQAAMLWLRKAAAQHHPSAIKALIELAE